MRVIWDDNNKYVGTHIFILNYKIEIYFDKFAIDRKEQLYLSISSIELRLSIGCFDNEYWCQPNIIDRIQSQAVVAHRGVFVGELYTYVSVRRYHLCVACCNLK